MTFQTPAIPDDSLRAVLDTVLGAPAYQWNETTPRLSWLARWWRTLVDWLDNFRQTNPTAADILFWSLVVILVIIFVHGGWIMYQTVREGTARAGKSGETVSLLVRDERWFRQQAEQLAGQGRYAEAMQAAFTSLVLRFDSRSILRYHPSKTPREYAREARLDPEEKGRLQESVKELYAHAYAGEPCRPDQYQRWLQHMTGEWHAAQG